MTKELITNEILKQICRKWKKLFSYYSLPDGMADVLNISGENRWSRKSEWTEEN